MKVSIKPDEIDRLKEVPPDVLAEAVDVAWIEFLTSIKSAAIGIGISPEMTLSWLLTQIVDENYHWATGLGRKGFVNFRRSNRYLGKTFAESIAEKR